MQKCCFYEVSTFKMSKKGPKSGPIFGPFLAPFTPKVAKIPPGAFGANFPEEMKEPEKCHFGPILAKNVESLPPP